MAATVIDGKAAAARLRASVAQDAATFANRHGRRPRLCVVIVGDNPASRAYVRTKTKMAAEAGLEGELIELPVTISTEELLGKIDGLNRDPHTHGILVQLPLPKQIDDEAVLHAILAEKDVDGFHPLNVGRLFSAGRDLPDDLLVPCTPYGCLLSPARDPRRKGPGRQGSGHRRPLEHRRQADGGPAPGCRLHRHHRPFAHPRPARGLPPRRHPGGGPGPAGVHPGRLGQAGGHGDRRRHQSGDRRGRAGPAGRRRRLRARRRPWPVRSPRSRAASAR